MDSHTQNSLEKLMEATLERLFKSHISQLREEFKGLSYISSKCERINNELIGISGTPDPEAAVEIVENITIRQMLEQINYDVNKLKNQLDDVQLLLRNLSENDRSNNKVVLPSNSSNSAVRIDLEKTLEVRPVELLGLNTQDEELLPVNNEVEIVENGEVPSDVEVEEVVADNDENHHMKEISAKTVEEEDASILNDLRVILSKCIIRRGSSLPVARKNINSQNPSTKNLAVFVENYLNVHLTELVEISFKDRGNDYSLQHVKVVKAESIGVLLYDMDYGVDGIISYLIDSTNLKLIVRFWVHEHNSLFAIALWPREAPVNEAAVYSLGIDYYMDLHRSDKRCSHASRQMAIKYRDFRASLQITSPDEIKVTIGSLEKITRVPTAYLPSDEAFGRWANLMQKGTLQNNPAAHGGFDYSVAIKLCNATNSDFESPSVFTESGTASWEISAATKSCTKEIIAFHDSHQVKGVTSVRLHGTDILLAIAFSVEQSGNAFGVGFFPSDIETQETLLSTLLTPDEFQVARSDRKLSGAKDGAITLELRNIVVHAKMTSGARALLTVTVVTL